jgi:hypothetical protein
MSSAERPEFFLDRSLGRTTASRLREAGYVVHLIADHYVDDASDIPDEEWITEGCANGWVLLTKDKRIRYRAEELEALQEGHLRPSLLPGQRQLGHRPDDASLPGGSPQDRARGHGSTGRVLARLSRRPDQTHGAVTVALPFPLESQLSSSVPASASS